MRVPTKPSESLYIEVSIVKKLDLSSKKEKFTRATNLLHST